MLDHANMKTLAGIQRTWGKSLGESWLSINYFINLGLRKQKKIRMSNWYTKRNVKQRAKILKEILPLLQYNEIIELGSWKSTIDRIDTSLLWKYSHIPTKIVWNPNQSRQICYQFDARSKHPARFHSAKIERKVLSHATKLGYQLVRLSKRKTLKQCVTDAATSEFFLGVDSGMFHLVSSVGTPVLYCENNRPIKRSYNHSNKHFVLTKNHMDLISAIDQYYHEGLSYYYGKARNIDLFKMKNSYI